jgi:hypothetical protein
MKTGAPPLCQPQIPYNQRVMSLKLDILAQNGKLNVLEHSPTPNTVTVSGSMRTRRRVRGKQEPIQRWCSAWHRANSGRNARLMTLCGRSRVGKSGLLIHPGQTHAGRQFNGRASTAKLSNTVSGELAREAGEGNRRGLLVAVFANGRRKGTFPHKKIFVNPGENTT